MKKPLLSRLTIRGKMTLAAVFPLGVVLLLVAIAAFSFINARVVGQAQKSVRHDLSAAREVMGHLESRLEDFVQLIAHTPQVKRSLSTRRSWKAEEALEPLLAREGVDFLSLTDAQGGALGEGPSPPPAILPLVKQALQGQSACGTVLLQAQEMEREKEGLSVRARIPLYRPAPGQPELETRGMFLVCASPVSEGDAEVVGSTYGGILLNGNLPLVDRIKEIVYGEAPYRGVAAGSATIFLEDVRIATTVRLRGEERALGTRVSAEVAEAVLEKQEPWIDRARVVDEWYLTAYEPILNPEGRSIGALYVGLLERPFAENKERAALILGALLLLGGGLGYFLARSISERLSRPLRRLESGAQRIAEGQRDIVLPVTTRDEVGAVTETFNRMAAALREKEDQLQSLNRSLEDKVLERTALLEEKSHELIRARERLMQAEKLAAIGSLAAGVAHEINNPAAIIRGNVEILLCDLRQGDDGHEEADEILRQTERISHITANMLSFARQQTFHWEEVSLNALLEEVLSQVSHQTPFGSVRVLRRLDPQLPEIEGDAECLRQVLNNLVLNALQAMEGEGTLEVGSARRQKGVEVWVSDSGPGIPEELRERIFHPFLTTKRKGTGLGLSVSYGIVRGLGGTIEVESEPGAGATFRVCLPFSP